MDSGFKDRRWMDLADNRDKRQDWVVSGVGKWRTRGGSGGSTPPPPEIPKF
jgi:hypothetical protein